jgi:hypothetical protein
MSKSKTSSPAVDRGLEVERVEVSTLLNDPANVRKHNERNLESIKASLARFGQQKPIVVGRDGVVIAGNGTLAAARSPTTGRPSSRSGTRSLSRSNSPRSRSRTRNCSLRPGSTN